MYEYFDIHSHLSFPEFNTDRERVIEQMKREKIATTVVGTGHATSLQAIALAEKHDNLYATIGLHPADNPARDGEFFSEAEYEKLVSHPKVVAVGECGLDFAWLDGDIAATIDRQKNQFEKQIDFAVKHNKSLMIHCRDAYPDCLSILQSKKKNYGDKLHANFHFFTSPLSIAKLCLDLGFTLSFTGPITFVPHYEEVVSYVPLESMMVETDAPFAAPAPYRGRRNEPLYVKEIVKKIAEIKKEDEEMVKRKLVENALKFYKIKLQP